MFIKRVNLSVSLAVFLEMKKSLFILVLRRLRLIVIPGLIFPQKPRVQNAVAIYTFLDVLMKCVW